MRPFVSPSHRSVLDRRNTGARRSAGFEHDRMLDVDSEAPNARAQFRGHIATILFLALAGVVGVVGGVLQNFDAMMAAFPSWDALTRKGAWDQFLTAGGHMLLLAGALVLLAFLVRRKRRGKRDLRH